MDAEVLSVKKKRFKWLTPELRITLRYFLCFAMFFSIIDRWLHVNDNMENISDSSLINPSYVSKIDTEIYLMKREQLKQLFQDNPLTQFDHWDPREPGNLNNSAPIYLALRIRNNGDQMAWGSLIVHSSRWSIGDGINTRSIPIHNLPPRMSGFETIILVVSSSIDELTPYKEDWNTPSDITVDWSVLYTSKGKTDGR